jgi:peptidoglycan/xylan/chitin deacetylase (PgdA/CDA1 family)
MRLGIDDLMSGFVTRLAGALQRGVANSCFTRTLTVDSDVPYISFTFDDFPRSALRKGGAILEKFGLLGTYYASFGLMNRDSETGRIFAEQDLRDLLSSGHELGCHTFSHCNSWSTRPETFEASMANNRTALGAFVEGYDLRSFSYPITVPNAKNKRIAGTHYSSCRCGGQAFNNATFDLNLLKAFFIEKSRHDASAIRQLIERNSMCRGWLIFATHDVDENPTRYGCTPKLFEEIARYSIDSGARIVRVDEALRQLQLPPDRSDANGCALPGSQM